MSDSPVCELRAGALRAAVRPDLGGSLAGLWWQGEPLLRSCEPGLLAGPRQSACFALLPYSNRIGHCRFDWRGQSYRTRPNFDDHPHSLHGVGWQRAWTVTAHTPDRLQLGLRHEPDADWPFAFSATQELQLSEDALLWRLSLRSCDGREQPAGLGWHPYFLHRAGSRLQTRVAGRWDMGADALPCGRTELPGLDLALAGAGLDHCFDGWSGEALVRDARHTLLLSASTRQLVVFTPPGAAHFCVEPVSHVNNAVQDAEPLAQGLVALAPGARLEAWMRLQRRDPIPSERP